MKENEKCIALKKDICLKCNLSLDPYEKLWQKHIENFRKNLHEWVLPITKLPIKEVFLNNYRMVGEKSPKYVMINNQKHYIYPENGEFINSRHKVQCRSTYRFFAELENIIREIPKQYDNYIMCKYFLAKLNYNGTDYVICKK